VLNGNLSIAGGQNGSSDCGGAATRKHTVVGQKYFKGGGVKRALRG